MKKTLLILIGICVLSVNAYGASSWQKIEPAGTRNASDIDTYVTTNNEAIDRISVSFRDNCAIYYVSTTSIGVKAGSVVCSNTAGTLRKFRTNTVVTSNAPVLGASTNYYIYAIADADATTFTLEVVTSATVPTTGTYYKRLGSFTTNSSSQIVNDDSIVNDNNYYALRLGDSVSKSQDVVYQASTDGFLTISGGAVTGDADVLSDDSSPPTTIIIRHNGDEAGFTCPIKRGKYYKITTSSGTLNNINFYPLEREV